nr:hypothetical protein [Tanacetum cinerariifolium]
KLNLNYFYSTATLLLLLAAACFYRQMGTGGVVVEVVGWSGSSENSGKRVYSVGGKNCALHRVSNVGDRDRGTILTFTLSVPGVIEDFQ